MLSDKEYISLNFYSIKKRGSKELGVYKIFYEICANKMSNKNEVGFSNTSWATFLDGAKNLANIQYPFRTI